MARTPAQRTRPAKFAHGRRLKGSESARLFLARARNRDPSFAFAAENAQAVAEVCSKLEGIPLAIELAAARVGTLSLEQISERLEGSLELLTRGGRTAVPGSRRSGGHSTGATTCSASESEKSVQEALGLCGRMDSGGLRSRSIGRWHRRERGPGAALRACGEVLVMARANRKGWRGALQAVGPHPPVRAREAGAERGGRGRKASSRRVLPCPGRRGRTAANRAAGSGVVRSAWKKNSTTSGRPLLGVEQAGEAELGLRLAGALRSFWFWEGHYGEGRRWIEGALSQEGPTSALARAKALGAASLLASEQSDYARAKGAAEEGLRLSKEAGTEDSRDLSSCGGTHIAFFLNRLATVSMDKGEQERAKALSEESLALSRQANKVQGIVWSLLIARNCSRPDRGDYEQAERLLC